MDALNYLHLYYFWIAANERGFLKASRRLGLNQSTVSTQIANLEKQLGSRLVERGPRTFELTPQGKTAYAYCESIFRQGEDLVREFKGEEPAGQALRIGFDVNLDFEFCSEFLLTLLQSPKDRFQVVTRDSETLNSALGGRQVDVVLSDVRPSPPSDRRVRASAFSESIDVLVSRSQWRRKKVKGTLGLGPSPLLLPPPGSQSRSALEKLAQAGGESLQIALDCADTGLLKSLALGGAGIALLPKKNVEREIKSGKLVVWREFRETESKKWVWYRQESEKHPSLRRMLKELGVAVRI